MDELKSVFQTKYDLALQNLKEQKQLLVVAQQQEDELTLQLQQASTKLSSASHPIDSNDEEQTSDQVISAFLKAHAQTETLLVDQHMASPSTPKIFKTLKYTQ